MKIRSITILFLSVILNGVGTVSSNEPLYSKESTELLTELEKNIKGTLLAISEAEKRSGNNMLDFHYSLELPENKTTNLGLVLDVLYSPKAFKVLSVTPGSEAEKLNIKSGDLILSINGIETSNESRNRAIKELQELIPGQQLKLKLILNGKLKELTTLLKGQYVPGIRLELGRQSVANSMRVSEEQESDSDACGEISVFFSPPKAKKIYPVGITKIDNVIRGSYSNYRLKPGKHIIKLQEFIDERELSFNRVAGIKKSKTIEIDVKEGITYYLGAEFIPRKQYTRNNGSYWQPVIWKKSKNKCTL